MSGLNLTDILSATLSKKRVAELVLNIKSELIDIQKLYEYCFHSDKTIAFRASWILETLVLQYPELFFPVLDQFLQDFPNQHNPSCQRHFTRILMTVQDKKSPARFREALGASDREALVEAVFDLLIDPKTPLAVLANSMDVLFAFSTEYDWIRDELSLQLDRLLDRGSPALNSRGKRLLKKMYK